MDYPQHSASRELARLTAGTVPRTTPCVSLIGMAGAGKTTLGRTLSKALQWVHVDTDRLLEAYWGCGLQQLVDSLGLEDFLRAEERLVSELWLWRCVISTGGSVVYGEQALAHLKTLGPVVYLHVSLPTVMERVQDGNGRGLACRAGQSLAQLYAEREPLYRSAADLILDMEGCSVEHGLERLCPLLLKAIQAGWTSKG